jgi:lipocalin
MRTTRILNLLLISLLLTAVLLSCGLTDEEIEKMDIVKDVDLDRYAGKWYEIARFPHRFEKDLVGVTATYTIRPDGKIGVLNEGYKNSLDGKYKKARAYAKVPDKENTGRLKVYFFWPFGADYLILELDKENYHYVLVGSSSDDYLWILCRDPKMDDSIYQKLVMSAAGRGYDTSRLQRVPQKIN